MNKEWITNRKCEVMGEINAEQDKIREIAKKWSWVDVDDMFFNIGTKRYYSPLFALREMQIEKNASIEELHEASTQLKLNHLEDLYHKYKSVDRYLDSEKKEFDGDIIITDPCYFVKDGHWDDEHSGYGSTLEKLGLSTFMTSDTLYGDWSCTTYNSDTKEEIGDFCADAGLVTVALYDEVKAYNPEFTDVEEKSWTTTLIKNFKGTVQFVIEYVTGEYEEDTEYWKKGEKWEDWQLHVVGEGIDKETGKPLNFITSQTGL